MNDRWTTILWEEKYNELDLYSFNNQIKIEGILFIKPPFLEITLADGFWGNLNKKFNKMFDFAEEEVVENNIIPQVVREILFYSKNNYTKEGLFEIIIGKEKYPYEKTITAQILYEELIKEINILCDFLMQANRNNKSVMFLF